MDIHEEVTLQKGEPILVSDTFYGMFVLEGNIRIFQYVENENIMAMLTGPINKWKFCIPLSKIDLNNLEATRYEILVARENKLYKFYAS